MDSDLHRLDITRDQQVWAMALWVDRVHGSAGWLHIAMEQDRLLEEGALDGVALWRNVQRSWKKIAGSESQAVRASYQQLLVIMDVMGASDRNWAVSRLAVLGEPVPKADFGPTDAFRLV